MTIREAATQLSVSVDRILALVHRNNIPIRLTGANIRRCFNGDVDLREAEIELADIEQALED